MLNVYCIIVTYNAQRWIDNCLSSIVEDKLDFHIIIVDNGSTDDTIKIIKSKYLYVQLIEAKENLGFAKANNLGFTIAKENKADFVYLLNQDTISYPDNIYNLINSVNFKNNEKIGVISPMHLNNSGDKLDSQFELYISSGSSASLISDSLLDKRKLIYPIGFVNAAAWLIKTETIEKVGGLFSSAFYHYGEDVNFIGRLRYFGFENILVTNVFVHHCREERGNKKPQKFLKKELFINSNVKLYNINQSLKTAYYEIFKYSVNQFLIGNFGLALNLLWSSLHKYKKVIRTRQSYLTKKII